jgi:hypothetical protein
LAKLGPSSFKTARTNSLIRRKGCLAGTRASGDMQENNPP